MVKFGPIGAITHESPTSAYDAGGGSVQHLPYFFADIEIKNENQMIYYQCKRRGSKDNFQYNGNYKPISSQYIAQSGTLDYWLTERYCLYTYHKKRVFRCDILHEPWSLQQAEAEIYINTMANIKGIRLPNEQPLLHYSERLDVLTWGLEEVNQKCALHSK